MTDPLQIDENEFLDPESGEVVTGEVKDLMDNHALDKDTAEEVQELVDEGLDEGDAVEINELLH